MAERRRSETVLTPEPPRAEIEVGAAPSREQRINRAREIILHQINAGKLKRAFGVLGFAVMMDQNGCASIHVNRRESSQATLARDRYELEHPSVEQMLNELRVAVGPNGLRELVPDLPEISGAEADAQMSHDRREAGVEMQGWEGLRVDPETVRTYYELGFPSIYSRSAIARLQWVNERLLARPDYWALTADRSAGQREFAGVCSNSPGNLVSHIRLSVPALSHDQPDDLFFALETTNHEYAHARDPRNAPEYVSREARVVAWWSVLRLLQSPDHPQSPYVNSIANDDPQQQNLNRVFEYFSEIERMVYETRETLPADEDWERFKTRTIAEAYDCSPAAAMRAIRISQYWAVQFQPADEAEGFDWAEAERLRYAYQLRLLQERARSLALTQIKDLADPQAREALAEGLRSGRMLSTLGVQSIIEAGGIESRDVLINRNFLFGSFGELRRALQNDQVSQQALYGCWISFSLNIQRYNQTFQRLIPVEIERLHALTDRHERARQVAERHEARLAQNP